MKKYNKPELKVENYLFNSTIANDPSGSIGENPYGNNATQNVTFDDWKTLFPN